MADNLERLDELLSAQERQIRRAFQEFVKDVGSGAALEAIIERLEANDVAGAMAIMQSYVERFGSVLPGIYQAVGADAAEELGGLADDIVMAVSFDPSNPRAADKIRTHRLGMIAEVSRQQRRSVQQAINRALSNGLGAEATGRAFRGAIGLTAYQENIVDNYRRNLENLNRHSLEYQLRDRRFDERVLAAIENDRPLTERQIETMTERYRDRFRAMRADTIARTQALQATSEAREEALEQMIEQTGIARERIDRFWNSTEDKRTRDWHASMDGQRQPYGKPFTDGQGNLLRFPGDPRAPANTIINCRCQVTFSVRPPA